MIDIGEMLAPMTCPLTFQTIMERVEVSYSEALQAAGRCGRHKDGVATVLTLNGAKPGRVA